MHKKAQGKKGGDAEKQRWADTFEAAKDGRFEDIEPELLVKYWSTLQRICEHYEVIPEDMEDLDFWWFCGDTGSGKSWDARKQNPSIYLKNNNKWWDGYRGQECVLIEEMDPRSGCYLGAFLKKWADHYAFNAEVKGGTKMLRPKKIIVTSNYSIQECFPDPAVHGPLNRRFTKVYYKGRMKTGGDDSEVTRTTYGKEEDGPVLHPGTSFSADGNLGGNHRFDPMA